MEINDLEKGQTLLVLRYSLLPKNNIIELHRELLEKNGFVWYGKLGAITSPMIVSELFTEKKPALMLYAKGNAYLCSLEQITNTKPRMGYPNYYDEEYIFPSCYYKLTTIDRVDVSILDKLYVRSSKRQLSSTLSKQCTSSCFFVSYEEIQPLKARVKKSKK